MIHDKIAFDPLKNTYPNKSEVQDLAEVLGFNATIKYEAHKIHLISPKSCVPVEQLLALFSSML